MTDREKLIDLLCKAHSKAIDEILSDDISYAQQLKIEADHLLANGVTFHKWVPVALGFFPEEHGRYLCVVRSHLFYGAFYQMILYYDQYGFRDGCIYNEDVVYWMPLPEMPKGEDKDGL